MPLVSGAQWVRNEAHSGNTSGGPVACIADQSVAPNSLLAVANSLATGLGGASGGFIAAIWGAGWAIGLDAVTFGVSAVLVVGLHTRPQPRSEAASLFSDIRDGWREFTAHRWLWTIVAQFSFVVMGWNAAYAVVGPIVADRQLGGASAWGIVALGMGAGLLTGGFIAMRWRPTRPLLVGSVCVFSFAIPTLLLVEPAPTPVLALGAFAAGLCGEMFGVYWMTALHTHVAPEALSRVSAYDVAGSLLFAPVGEALAGLAVARFDTGPTLEFCALLIIVPTALVLFVPEVRNLRGTGGSDA